jgi:hypothetical protein
MARRNSPIVLAGARSPMDKQRPQVQGMSQKSGGVVRMTRRKVFVVLGVWDTAWKIFAVTRALRNRQLKWALALAVTNSVGILPIVYLSRWSRPSDQGSSG